MKLLRLTVQRFTAFEDATFELGPWVNVFIAENGAQHEREREAFTSPTSICGASPS